MRFALRIVVVLVTVLAYYVVTTVVLWRVEVVNNGPERAFGDAVFQAIHAESMDADKPVVTVCGFPPPGKETYTLSHAEVVDVARCLRRDGYLSDSGLAGIESSTITIAGAQRGARPVPGAPAGSVQSSGSWTYGGDGVVRERPWWFIVVWLAGLAVVVWLVGFRLPWWRRRGQPLMRV